MRTRSLLVAAAAGLLSLGIAMPAFADTTTATVTVTGGALSISAPAAAGSLGTIANTVAGGTISGSLGQVQVNDARSAAAGSGWVASVISTAFTPSAGPTIAASAVELHGRDDHEGRHRHLHGERPGQPHRRLGRGHGDRDHRRQLRDLEPDDQRGGPRRHHRHHLLRDHHPLCCLAASVAAARDRGAVHRASAPLAGRCSVTLCIAAPVARGRRRSLAAAAPPAASGFDSSTPRQRGRRSSSPALHRGSPRPRDDHPTSHRGLQHAPHPPSTSSCTPQPPRSRTARSSAPPDTPRTICRPGHRSIPARPTSPPAERVTATVTIDVPSDAAPGEQYGVVWAEARSLLPPTAASPRSAASASASISPSGPAAHPRPTSRSTR